MAFGPRPNCIDLLKIHYPCISQAPGFDFLAAKEHMKQINSWYFMHGVQGFFNKQILVVFNWLVNELEPAWNWKTWSNPNFFASLNCKLQSPVHFETWLKPKIMNIVQAELNYRHVRYFDNRVCLIKICPLFDWFLNNRHFESLFRC